MRTIDEINVDIARCESRIRSLMVLLNEVSAERTAFSREKNECELQAYLQFKNLTMDLHLGDKVIVTEEQAAKLNTGDYIYPVGTILTLVGFLRYDFQTPTGDDAAFVANVPSALHIPSAFRGNQTPEFSIAIRMRDAYLRHIDRNDATD